MLSYRLTKTKYLVHSGQIRSVKDGGNRRILPEWVDEYIRQQGRGAVSVSKRGNGECSIFPSRDG